MHPYLMSYPECQGEFISLVVDSVSRKHTSRTLGTKFKSFSYSFSRTFWAVAFKKGSFLIMFHRSQINTSTLTMFIQCILMALKVCHSSLNKCSFFKKMLTDITSMSFLFLTHFCASNLHRCTYLFWTLSKCYMHITVIA